MNTTIEDLAKQQRILAAKEMYDFCIETLIVNLLTQMFAVFLIFMIYKYTLLYALKIKAYDATNKQNQRITGLRNAVIYLIKTAYKIGRDPEFQESFAKKYGFEIFNFLNFLHKIAAIVFYLFSMTIASSLFYYKFTNEAFNYLDFWIGVFNFKKHALYITTTAFIFACCVFYTLQKLRKECNLVHFKILQAAIKVPASEYGVLERSVFVSFNNQSINPKNMKNQIAKILDKKSSDDFLVLTFPKVHKTVANSIELRKTKFNFAAKRYPVSFFDQLLGRKVDDIDLFYRRKIEGLESEIRLANKKPTKLSSQAIVFFYRFEDLQRFHTICHLNRDSQRPISDSQSKTNQLVELSEKRVFFQNNKFYFMTSYSDLLIGEIHKYLFSYRIIKMLTFLVMTIILVFLTTPVAIVKNYFFQWFYLSGLPQKLVQILSFVLSPLSLNVMPLESEQVVATEEALNGPFSSHRANQYVLYTIVPFILILMNILMCLMFEKIGHWQKFPKHTFFHSFLFTTFYVYFMLNIFIMPGLLGGSSSSLFEMIIFSVLDVKQKFWHSKFYNNGLFFSNLIVQSSIVRLINDLLFLVKFVKSRLSYQTMFAKIKQSRKHTGERKISDVYEYGYNYSMDCVMFSVIYVFGIHQPLIFLSGLIYAFLRCISVTSGLTFIFKKQVYMQNKISDLSIARLFFAIPLSFFVLAIKFFFFHKFIYCLINVGFFVISGIIVSANPKKSFHLTAFLNRIEKNDSVDYLMENDELGVEEKNKIKHYFMNNIVDDIVRKRVSSFGEFDG